MLISIKNEAIKFVQQKQASILKVHNGISYVIAGSCAFNPLNLQILIVGGLGEILNFLFNVFDTYHTH